MTLSSSFDLPHNICPNDDVNAHVLSLVHVIYLPHLSSASSNDPFTLSLTMITFIVGINELQITDSVHWFVWFAIDSEWFIPFGLIFFGCFVCCDGPGMSVLFFLIFVSIVMCAAPPIFLPAYP
jgi:hypothetical protein